MIPFCQAHLSKRVNTNKVEVEIEEEAAADGSQWSVFPRNERENDNGPVIREEEIEDTLVSEDIAVGPLHQHLTNNAF